MSEFVLKCVATVKITVRYVGLLIVILKALWGKQ